MRLQPVVTSNVVTYTVIVDAPNPEMKLMPGMTANITVLVQRVDSVLTIPGKALRFTPDAAFLSEYLKNNPYTRPQGAANQAGAEGQRRNNETGQVTMGQNQTGAAEVSPATSRNSFQGGAQTGKKPVVVWVKNGDKIHRTRVATGAIDGTNAEIKSGLQEGDIVILSMTQAGKPSTSAQPPAATSPFMPQRPVQGGARR